MLLERPVSGRPSVSKSEEDAGAAGEQSPDFRNRWGSQQYQQPGQHHHRPSTWPSSNRPAGKIWFLTNWFFSFWGTALQNYTKVKSANI